MRAGSIISTGIPSSNPDPPQPVRHRNYFACAVKPNRLFAGHHTMSHSAKTANEPAISLPRRLATRLLMGGLGAAAAGLSLAGCAPVTVFDRLVRVESGGMRAATDIAYGNNPRQRYDIYVPADAANAPVAIFFYGGSWNSGSKSDYSFVGRTLAARGFVTIVVDYRLVPEVKFPAFIEDGAAAVAHVRKTIAAQGGDPQRMYLLGHSAGAYIAAMLTVTPRYLAAAGVPRSAIRATAGLAGPYDFYPFTAQAAVDAFGEAPDPNSTQPVRVAVAGAPPMLLLHGSDDTTVLPRNAERLAARLNALGSAAALKFYPGVGHVGMITAMTKTFGRQAPVTNDVVDFFNRHGARAMRVAAQS